MKIIYSHDTIIPEEVIKFLAFSGQSYSIYAMIIKNNEVVKKAKELNIEVPVEKLQEFADNFRISHGLHSSEETMNFLKNHGLTEEDFEQFCERALLAPLIKNHLADENKIVEYFVNNRLELDLARISIILVKEESLAKEIMIQITDDGEDFHALARKYSIDEATKYCGGYFGLISRQVLPPEITAKVFNATPGDLLGPIKQDDFFQLILVEELVRAELNDKVKEVIKERIIEEWASQFIKEGIKVVL